ncbi:MAG: C40 family peptidase [Crocinitomicaceae bacterium]|nr:C40 family peptidase [Crocinitomicaceae bacterium]
MNWRIIFTIVLTTIGFNLFAQEKNLDMLEMYYDQEHYKIVLRKANKLLDNPDYDYTVVPSFYKSMVLFQMNQNKNYRKRNKNSLNEAIELWDYFRKYDNGNKVFDAHIHEIIELKQDLIMWNEDLKQRGEVALSEKISGFLVTHFDKVDNIIVQEKEIAEVPSNKDVKEGSVEKRRLDLIKYSKSLIGIKYKYGGTDKTGFDCSGFTSYVYKKFDIELPRRAADQQAKSKKIKIKDAKVGDLVFFSSGGGVNHVGIIVSNENGKPIMIHASTSQGIVETDILGNSYWKPRLKFVGSYLE